MIFLAIVFELCIGAAAASSMSALVVFPGIASTVILVLKIAPELKFSGSSTSIFLIP